MNVSPTNIDRATEALDHQADEQQESTPSDKAVSNMVNISSIPNVQEPSLITSSVTQIDNTQSTLEEILEYIEQDTEQPKCSLSDYAYDDISIISQSDDNTSLTSVGNVIANALLNSNRENVGSGSACEDTYMICDTTYHSNNNESDNSSNNKSHSDIELFSDIEYNSDESDENYSIYEPIDFNLLIPTTYITDAKCTKKENCTTLSTSLKKLTKTNKISIKRIPNYIRKLSLIKLSDAELPILLDNVFIGLIKNSLDCNYMANSLLSSLVGEYAKIGRSCHYVENAKNVEDTIMYIHSRILACSAKTSSALADNFYLLLTALWKSRIQHMPTTLDSAIAIMLSFLSEDFSIVNRITSILYGTCRECIANSNFSFKNEVAGYMYNCIEKKVTSSINEALQGVVNSMLTSDFIAKNIARVYSGMIVSFNAYSALLEIESLSLTELSFFMRTSDAGSKLMTIAQNREEDGNINTDESKPSEPSLEPGEYPLIMRLQISAKQYFINRTIPDIAERVEKSWDNICNKSFYVESNGNLCSFTAEHKRVIATNIMDRLLGGLENFIKIVILEIRTGCGHGSSALIRSSNNGANELLSSAIRQFKANK